MKNTRLSIYEDFFRETAAIPKEKWEKSYCQYGKRYDTISKLPYCYL